MMTALKKVFCSARLSAIVWQIIAATFEASIVMRAFYEPQADKARLVAISIMFTVCAMLVTLRGGWPLADTKDAANIHMASNGKGRTHIMIVAWSVIAAWYGIEWVIRWGLASSFVDLLR